MYYIYTSKRVYKNFKKKSEKRLPFDYYCITILIQLKKGSLVILDIDFHSGVPIYRQIVTQVQRLILSGILGEGHQMESVRDLSGRLKVNPMTVSKAYSILESEGLLQRRRGLVYLWHRWPSLARPARAKHFLMPCSVMWQRRRFRWISICRRSLRD